MKLLICGDSFSADWTKKYPGSGWPNLLALDHQVSNLSQPGCSEYKILQQLKSQRLDRFDAVIISHTSPYRIYVKQHPVHANDVLHHSCDLIYSDIKEHSNTRPDLAVLVEFFERYFDPEYACDIHNMICEKIDQLCGNHPVIHLSHIDWSDLYQFKNMINFEALFQKHRGNINHFDAKGNQTIYTTVSARLGSITC
jgi:hypothetical protein